MLCRYVTGFSSGFIYWDDEDISNGNSHGGALPDGDFGSNTKIYYCCRYDVDYHCHVYLVMYLIVKGFVTCLFVTWPCHVSGLKIDCLQKEIMF